MTCHPVSISKRLRGGVLAVLLAVTLTPAAQGDDGSTITVQIENDWFARATNTDRHYTTGMRAAWLSGDTDIPDWLSRVTDLPSLFIPATNEPVTNRIGVALGQTIFTPDDTETAAFIPGDRPYAAWLFLTLSLNVTHRDERGPSRQDTFAAEVGVVGPYAFGREVQNNYHDLIDVAKSAGWDNQIDNEPGFNFIFERKWRTGTFEFAGLQADVIPYLNLSLGNVMTFGGGGGLVRLSTDLSDDFGPSTIRPGLPGSENFRPGGDLGWYVFAGAGARVVGRNIFLDGNTVGGGSAVSKKYLVGDFQLGFSVTVEDVRFTYTHVFRSPEFDGQKRFDQFGALSAAVRF